MPIITFIIPLKEWEPKKLELLLISLKNIAIDNKIEIIVIYSGLTPEKYTDQLDSETIITRIIYAEPKGIYNAYNIGASYATSDWIMFLGGDDFVLPSLNILIKNLQSFATYDAIACWVVYGTKGILKPFHIKHGLVFQNWCHQGVVYKKKLFRFFKYDERYPIQADHKFNIEISKIHKIKYLDLTISYFNTEGISQTQPDPLFYHDMPMIVKNSFGYFWSLVSIFRRILGKVKRKLV